MVNSRQAVKEKAISGSPEFSSTKSIDGRAGSRQISFFRRIEGLRALAAVGVLTTHVAFQTGAITGSIFGNILGRLDLAVAVFFGISGCLLWRSYTPPVGEIVKPLSVAKYYRHRVVRIMPAYVVVVTVVLFLLPAAQNANWQVWMANLTLTQLYVPLTLTAGLTQMWSLSVEVSFYLVLPILGWIFSWIPQKRNNLRVPLLGAAGLCSLVWPYIAAEIPVPMGLDPKSWLPGYLLWFIVGMIGAELIAAGPTYLPRVQQALINPWVAVPLLLLFWGLAITPLAGPATLAPISELAYIGKIFLGAGVAVFSVLPLALKDSHDLSENVKGLASPLFQALGRWSYGIFIWHLLILELIFGLIRIFPFSGNFILVWLLVVVGSVFIAAISYAVIEVPARK